MSGQTFMLPLPQQDLTSLPESPHQRGQQKPLNGNSLAYIQLSELDGVEEIKGALQNTSACARQTQHDCNLHLTTINFRSKA